MIPICWWCVSKVLSYLELLFNKISNVILLSSNCLAFDGPIPVIDVKFLKLFL